MLPFGVAALWAICTIYHRGAMVVGEGVCITTLLYGRPQGGAGVCGLGAILVESLLGVLAIVVQSVRADVAYGECTSEGLGCL